MILQLNTFSSNTLRRSNTSSQNCTYLPSRRFYLIYTHTCNLDNLSIEFKRENDKLGGKRVAFSAIFTMFTISWNFLIFLRWIFPPVASSRLRVLSEYKLYRAWCVIYIDALRSERYLHENVINSKKGMSPAVTRIYLFPPLNNIVFV